MTHRSVCRMLGLVKSNICRSRCTFTSNFMSCLEISTHLGEFDLYFCSPEAETSFVDKLGLFSGRLELNTSFNYKTPQYFLIRTGPQCSSHWQIILPVVCKVTGFSMEGIDHEPDPGATNFDNAYSITFRHKRRAR
jgi:hypothetical protein